MKAADQTSNMRSIIETPPCGKEEQGHAYIAKARAVVAKLMAPIPMKLAFSLAADAAERKIRSTAVIDEADS